MLASCLEARPWFFILVYLVQADVGHVGKVGEVGHSWHTTSASHAFQPQTGVVCDHLCQQVEDGLFVKFC